ncbi:unnamed protein product [Caenorhabditis nigoni]
MNNFLFFGIPDLLKWKILVFLALSAVLIILFAIICLVIQRRRKYSRLVEVTGEISNFDVTESESLAIDGHFVEFFETRENADLTRNAIIKQNDKQVAAILEKTKTTLIQQEILGSIGLHPNVSLFLNFANLIDSPVWEYIEGRPLRSFLKEHKNQFSNQIVYSEFDPNGYMLPRNKMQKTDELEKLGVFKPILCTSDLISFAHQIADGMKYLAEKMIVHQNLALHNIYITANKTIRIRGFDFARIRNYRPTRKRELVSLLNYDKLDYDAHYEVDPRHLEIGRKLGEGQYGFVNQARLKNGIDVAVKRARLPYDPNQQKMLLDEIKIMCAIKFHPNVLALVGAVTSENLNGALIITEYAENGSLLDYLRNIKNQSTFSDLLVYQGALPQKTGTYNKGPGLSNDLNLISTVDLISFAYQIANGMVYLARIPCVHRDLALRNVLLMADGTIRIGDFRLTRRHEHSDYYRISNPDIPLPVYWMAPECFQTHKFTEKTDIWSFGVSLFEIFTLGDKPYAGVGDILKFLENERLGEPNYSNKEIYEFMNLCWGTEPQFRPNFKMCSDFFKGQLKKICKEGDKILEDKLNSILENRCDRECWIRREIE